VDFHNNMHIAAGAGTYWFLQKTGIEHCQKIGKSWDYAGWKCNTG